MKLSEAILTGAKLRPQGFGNYFTNGNDPDPYALCSCTMGAAIEGVTGQTSSSYAVMCNEMAEWGLYVGGLPTPLFYRIENMNDEQKLTREQIANVLAWEGL